MEAPEKIYLVEDRQKHEPMEYWYNSTTDDSKIEYTRTDAFIEKAWDWIEGNLLSSNQQDKSCLYFKQFKDYMQGE